MRGVLSGARDSRMGTRLLTAPGGDQKQWGYRQAQRNITGLHAAESAATQVGLDLGTGMIVVPRFLDAEDFAEHQINPVLGGQRREKHSARLEPAVKARHGQV